MTEDISKANERNANQRKANRELLRENLRLKRELYGLRSHWRTMTGFATCVSGPTGYAVNIAYPTLAKAQESYRALVAIGEVLNDCGPWRYVAAGGSDAEETK